MGALKMNSLKEHLIPMHCTSKTIEMSTSLQNVPFGTIGTVLRQLPHLRKLRMAVVQRWQWNYNMLERMSGRIASRMLKIFFRVESGLGPQALVSWLVLPSIEICSRSCRRHSVMLLLKFPTSARAWNIWLTWSQVLTHHTCWTCQDPSGWNWKEGGIRRRCGIPSSLVSC